MGAERFKLACGLAGRATDGGEFDRGLERPLAVGSQAGRSEQFGDTSERHETHVDKAAPADIAAQVESCIGCWHDDGDGCEGVLGLMFTQEAFQTFLRLFDVFDIRGGLLHVSCLHCGALGARSVCYIPEYTTGYAVAAHNRGVKMKGRRDCAAGGRVRLPLTKRRFSSTVLHMSLNLSLKMGE